MSKRLYSYKRVKYWYAYDVDDICALYAEFGLHAQTVRAWQKKGLKTIDKGNPSLVYGYDLIEYLKEHNTKNKCQTAFDEMFCFKCQDARNIFQRKISIQHKAKTLFVSGHCRDCKTVMFKTYKMDNLHELKRIFHVGGVLELYDCKASPCKTHLQAHAVTSPNESLNSDLQRDLFG